MLHPIMRVIVRREHLLSLMILLLLLVSATVARAQGGVGSSRGLPTSSGGIHTIQGTVYFPSSQQVTNKRVRVRLDSSIDFTSQSAQTDDDGTFRFTHLEAGSYTVTVDGGKEYESAVENVSIDREASTGGRILSVPIYLKPKPDSSIPKTAVDLYRKAQESARSGNSKKAVEQLNSALALDPKFTLALNELGQQYLKLGQASKAEESFRTVLKLKPDDPTVHLNLGMALFSEKKYEEAETHLREAVRTNDASMAAHYYLGMTLVNLKKRTDAEKELESAISKGGDNLPQAHRYLGGLYWSSNKYQQAADELEKYLKLDPKAPDAEKVRAIIKDLRSKG